MATTFSFNDILVVDTPTTNVGVGTTSPNDQVHIYKATSTSLKIQAAGSTSVSRLRLVESSTLTSNLGAVFKYTNNTDTMVLGFNDGSSDGDVLSAVRSGANASSISLLTGGTNALFIDSTQRVGINTASPTTQLDVLKNGVANIVQARSDTQALFRLSVGTVVLDVNSTTTLAELRTLSNHGIQFTTNSLSRLTLDASGDLTLGNATVDAERWFAFTGAGTARDYGVKFGANRALWTSTSYSAATILGSSNTERLRIESDGTFYFRMASNAGNNSIVFNTTVNNALSVNSSGYVGIGTVNASNQLHINATNPIVRLQGSTDSAYLDYNNTRLQISAGGGYLQLVTGNANRWILDTSGSFYPNTDDTGQLGAQTNRVNSVYARRYFYGTGAINVKQRGAVTTAAAGTTGWRKIATLLVDADDWQSGKTFEVTARRWYATGTGVFGNETATFVVSTDGYGSTIGTVFVGTYKEGFGNSISFGIQNFTTTGTGTTKYYTADIVMNVAEYLFYTLVYTYSADEFASAQQPPAILGVVFPGYYITAQETAAADLVQYTTPATFVSRAGNVGIGNATAAALLQVGNGAYAGTPALTGGMQLRTSAPIYVATDGTRTAIFGTDGTTYSFVGTLTSHNFSIRTANTDAIVIDTTQQVSIGAGSSPSAKLHVNGTILGMGGLRIEGSSGWSGRTGGTEVEWTGTAGYVTAFNRSASTWQPLILRGSLLALQTGGNDRLYIDANGQIGVGLTPNSWNTALRALELRTNAIWNFNSGSDSVAYWTVNAFLNTSGVVSYKYNAAASQYSHSGGQHIWQYAASGVAGNAVTWVEGMRLDNSGRLGLGGVTSPAYRLDVSGDINFTSALYLSGTKHWTEGSTATVGMTALAAALRSMGRKIYVDECFAYGTNGIFTYDNSASGQVAVTRVSSSGLDAPNNSGFVMQVTHTGTGSSPGYGGFYFGAATRANATLVCVFRAKIPAGYSLSFATNSIGTSGNNFWVTGNTGTGTWQDYVYIVKCGSTGTFSSTMFFYLTGSPAPSAGSPVTWYISSATVFDQDDRVTYVANANTGSGATNYLSKWTSASNLGTSVVYDDGTNVGIGTSSPTAGFRLDVRGAARIQVADPRLDLVGTYRTFLTQVVDGANAAASYWRLYDNTAGTTSPRLKVDASGNFSVTKSDGVDVFRISQTGSVQAGVSTAGMLLDFRTNNPQRMDILWQEGPFYFNPDRGSTSISSVQFYENSGPCEIGLSTTNATAVNTLYNSSYIALKGKYWNGTATAVVAPTLQTVMDSTAPLYRLVLTAGSGNLSVRSDGNVGVGTGAPASPLHVYRATTGTVVRIQHGVTSGFADNVIAFNAANTATNTQDAYIDLITNNGNAAEFLFGSSAAIPVTFRSSGQERMRILATGNVGIGNTSPSSPAANYTLAVGTGANNLQNAVRIYGGVDANKAPVLSLFRNGNTETLVSNYQSGALSGLALGAGGGIANFNDATINAYCQLFLTTGGRLGLNVAEPDTMIEARGTDAGIVVHYFNNSRGGIYAFASQRVAFATTGTGDNLVFGYTGSPGTSAGFVERARLVTLSGNFGIGTTSPGERLTVSAGSNDRLGADVSGAVTTLTFGSTVNAEAIRTIVFDRSTGSLHIKYGVNGSALTNGLTLDGTGNVGIGTTSTLGNSLLNVALGITARNSSTTAPAIQLYNANAGVDLKTWRFVGNSDGSVALQTVNDAYSASNERLRVSGNVLAIGSTVTTDASRLVVRGNTAADEVIARVDNGNATVTTFGYRSILEVAGLNNGGTYTRLRMQAKGGGSNLADFVSTEVGTPDNASLNLFTNNTTRMSIDSAGLVTVSSGNNLNIANGNVIIGTSGKGIDFSATPGTGTQELLDDYEEGTWTPSLSSSSGTLSGTGTGRYTKVGRLVTVQYSLQPTTVTTATGNVFINNLPFTSSSTGYGQGVSSYAEVYAGTGWGTTFAHCLATIFDGGSTSLTIYRYDTSHNWQFDVATKMTTSAIICGTFSYITDA